MIWDQMLYAMISMQFVFRKQDNSPFVTGLKNKGNCLQRLDAVRDLHPHVHRG